MCARVIGERRSEKREWRSKRGRERRKREEERGRLYVPATGREHSEVAQQEPTVVVGKLDRDVSRSFLPLPTHTTVSKTSTYCTSSIW